MTDRVENKPSPEQVSAVQTLRRKLGIYLASRSTETGEPLSPERYGVRISFEKISPSVIPPSLREFITEQYLGRQVGVCTIDIESDTVIITAASLSPRSKQEEAAVRQRVLTETVAEVEQREAFQYFIYPDNNLVLENTVEILPSTTQTSLQTAINAYPLDEWLIRDTTTPEAIVVNRAFRPSILFVIAALIPEPTLEIAKRQFNKPPRRVYRAPTSI